MQPYIKIVFIFFKNKMTTRPVFFLVSSIAAFALSWPPLLVGLLGSLSVITAFEVEKKLFGDYITFWPNLANIWPSNIFSKLSNSIQNGYQRFTEINKNNKESKLLKQCEDTKNKIIYIEVNNAEMLEKLDFVLNDTSTIHNRNTHSLDHLTDEIDKIYKRANSIDAANVECALTITELMLKCDTLGKSQQTVNDAFSELLALYQDTSLKKTEPAMRISIYNDWSLFAEARRSADPDSKTFIPMITAQL